MTRRTIDLSAINAGRTRRNTGHGMDRAPRAHETAPVYADIARELDEIAAHFEQLKHADLGTRRSRPAPSFNSPAPQRMQERSETFRRPRPQADVSDLSQAIGSLKADIRAQMQDQLDQQYDVLRAELRGLEEALRDTPHQDTFRADLGELYGALESLSESNRQVQDSQHVLADTLHSEFSALKDQFSALARNDSVQTIANRMGSLEDRWSRMEDRFDHATGADLSDDLAQISQRLDALHGQMSSLPDFDAMSGHLPHIEDKIATLASGVQALASQSGRMPDFSAMEMRFDELSRAIAGLSMARESDTPDLSSAFHALEDRIASLQERIEQTAARELPDYGDHFEALQDRIQALGQTGAVDAIADRLEQMESLLAGIGSQRGEGADLDQLGSQMAAINARLDELARNPGDSTHLLAHLDARFGELESKLDRARASQAIGSMSDVPAEVFDHLDRRFEGLQAAIANVGAGSPGGSDAALAERLEARFAELSTQMKRFEPRGGDEEMFAVLDSRLADIAHHLEQQAHAAPASPQDSAALSAIEDRIATLGKQISGLAMADGSDPAALADLNEKIAALSAQIAHVEAHGAPIDTQPLDARLEAVAAQIDEQRADLLEAARMAAEQAVQSLAQSGGDGMQAAMASRLAEDIAELDALTRQSNERNAQTIGAIHDTLIKIVDRIADLDARTGMATAKMPQADPFVPAHVADEDDDTALLTPDTVPGMDPDVEDLVADDVVAGSPKAAAQEAAKAAQAPTGRKKKRREAKMTPSEAAQAAAMAALDDNEGFDPEFDESSFDADFDDGPMADGDDEPIEPNAAIPDLQAILKRVREQKKNTQTATEPDANEKDFFASVKRAAQAAAKEAQTTGGKGSAAGGAKDRLQSVYSRFRKPILMVAGAAIIAIAALQLGSAFLGGSPDAELTLQDETVDDANVEPFADLPEGASIDLGSTDLDDMGNVDLAADPGDPLEAETLDPVGVDAIETDPTIQAIDLTAPDASDAASAAIERAEQAANPDLTLPEGFGPVALAQAAQAGDPRAQFEVGRRLTQQPGAQGDVTEAVEWFRAAADAGYAPAQYRIGNLYEKGIGLAKDPAQAKVWYQMAAEQGNASAMHNLAVLHATGAAGPADPDSAGRWFIKAAELGVKDSQFNLGILHAKGQGVPQDLEESYKWFAIVAKTGDNEAASKRDEVAKAMRPEQLQSARGKAELWRPKSLVEDANVVDLPEEWRIEETTTAGVDVKRAITNVQAILNRIGYDAGPADGIMGERTRQAIRDFQGANGMPATGEIDEALVRALLARNNDA